MPNEYLRNALLQLGLTTADAAKELEVDPKTVERWITTDRLPYRRHRLQLSALLGQTEAYLWPSALDATQRVEQSGPEVVAIYPHRVDSPAGLWSRLLAEVSEALDFLVYAALFLPEQQPRLLESLAEKASAGIRIRLLIGDPDAHAVAQRGLEEQIGDALAYRIRNAFHHFEPLSRVANVEIRMHSTVLYNSIFRFDDEMLVTPHVYGLPGAHAPLLHLRRLNEGALFTTYAESLEKIWHSARAATDRKR